MNRFRAGLTTQVLAAGRVRRDRAETRLPPDHARDVEDVLERLWAIGPPSEISASGR